MSNTVAIICSKIQNLKQSVDSNPPIRVSRPNKHPCAGQGCGFELPTVAIRWLLDLNWRTYLKCLWLRFLHRSCWESWSCNFRIAFLEKFWKDWALIRMGHGYISGGLGAGIFEVRNEIVWRQFQLNWTGSLAGGWLLPALSPSLVLTAEVKYSSHKIVLKTAWDGEKNMTHDSFNTFFKFLLKFALNSAFWNKL